MRPILKYLTSSWQPIAIGILFTIIFSGLLMFRLTSLVPGSSLNESFDQSSKTSYSSLLKQPINAPYYIVRNSIRKFGENSIKTDRYISVIFGLIALLTFYGIARFWFSQRISMLGLIVLATSTWFLHISRNGSPEILQLAGLAILYFSIWIHRAQNKNIPFLLLLISLAVSLYIPGFIWFTVFIVAWQNKKMLSYVKSVQYWWIAVSVLAFTILITPLVYGVIKDPGIIKTLIGLPNYAFSIKDFGTNLYRVPENIFIRSILNPSLTIGHLPLLNIFAVVMSLLGIYSYIKNFRLDRSWVGIAVTILGIILISLNGSVGYVFIIPGIFLLVISGISYLLEEWNGVFPKNPLAGNIGASLLSILVILSVFYSINNYFIAWPNAPATKSYYSQRL